MRTLYIRPVYDIINKNLIGFSLCKLKNTLPITDSDIIIHFPPETPEKEMKDHVHDFHSSKVKWGTLIASPYTYPMPRYIYDSFPSVHPKAIKQSNYKKST